ncbi:MAG: TolC family protein [Muribaculaceae bacterium]|nr:TolC family protein [Muribaculaceae bacterium]
MNRRNILAIILATVTALSGVSQVNTLKSCIDNGLENNYSLKIVRNDEKTAANNATIANAGYLPEVNFSAGYSGTLDNTNTTARSTGEVSKERGVADHTLHAGLDLNWTLFDGFKIQANYSRLQELKRQSETITRIAIEDYVAGIASEYYNFVQQKVRMKNLEYAVELSRERMRIVYERYIIGQGSKLEYKQAQVDFNADRTESIKQREMLASSRIRLKELMGDHNVKEAFDVVDSIIVVENKLDFDSLWSYTLEHNTSILKAAQNRTLAELDMKTVSSRDYPYLKLNAGYGYTYNKYGINATSKRSNWGADFGITLGMKIFDGNRSRERRNARIAVENAELEQRNLELNLYADLCDLWQAYENNLRLLELERENVKTARENHEIACERNLLGDLAGIEMREAQKSLLDAEERLLETEYDTKICEISLLLISGKILTYLN